MRSMARGSTKSKRTGTKPSLLAALTAEHSTPRKDFTTKLGREDREALSELRRQVRNGECSVPKNILHSRFVEATGVQISLTQFRAFLNDS